MKKIMIKMLFLVCLLVFMFPNTVFASSEQYQIGSIRIEATNSNDYFESLYDYREDIVVLTCDAPIYITPNSDPLLIMPEGFPMLRIGTNYYNSFSRVVINDNYYYIESKYISVPNAYSDLVTVEKKEPSVSDEAINMTRVALQNVPENILEKFIKEEWKIVLTDKVINNTWGIDGYTYVGNKTITLVSWNAYSMHEHTLLHELGHFVHIMTNADKTNELQQLLQTDGETIQKILNQDGYFLLSKAEYFADMFYYSTINKSAIYAVIPNTYNYISYYTGIIK